VPEAAQDAAAPDARRARMGEPVDAIAVYKREFPEGAFWSMGARGRPIDEVLPPFHSLQLSSEEETARQGCARVPENASVVALVPVPACLADKQRLSERLEPQAGETGWSPAFCRRRSGGVDQNASWRL